MNQATPPCSGRAPVRHYLLVAFIVLLATVPFLDKAFHVDDNYYLQVARQILKSPLRPYDFSWIGQGHRISAFTNYAPPFFAYCLALGISLFGEREIPLHCLSALFTAVAAVSMYVLAARFCTRPLLATLLFLLNPLFVPSQNVMVDTPMVALGLAGLACHVTGTDRGRVSLILLGGILAGFAFVTKYPAIIVFPLMMLYSAAHRSWWVIPALVLGSTPFILWSIDSLLVHGVLHFPGPLYAGYQLTREDMFRRAIALTMILGSGFCLLLTAPRLTIGFGWRLLFLVTSVGLAVAWRCVERPTDLDQSLHHGVFLSSGLFLLFSTLFIGIESAVRGSGVVRFDACFLTVWLLVAWFIPVSAPFIAVRHVLLGLAPAAIVWSRMFAPGRATTVWAFLAVPAFGALGLSVGWGDRELANLHRRAVMEFKGQLGGLQRNAYYLGEDGFSYYSAVVGMEPYVIDETVLAPGDLILSSASTAWGFPESLRSTLLQNSIVHLSGRVPVNTMSEGVNFYRTGTFDLPWELGRPTEIYQELNTKRRVRKESE